MYQSLFEIGEPLKPLLPLTPKILLMEFSLYFADFIRFYLFLSDPLRFLQISSDSFRFLQIPSDSYRFFQMLSDSFIFSQMLSDSFIINKKINRYLLFFSLNLVPKPIQDWRTWKLISDLILEKNLTLVNFLDVPRLSVMHPTEQNIKIEPILMRLVV